MTEKVAREVTPFGFQFGAALVERVAEERGDVLVTVSSRLSKLDVHVAKNGRMRYHLSRNYALKEAV